jgi:hypothetical protein
MNYTYKIIYDINKDIWNWYDALNSPFEGFGFSWIDNVEDLEDRKIAKQIMGISKTSAENILTPYLLLQKNNSNSKLNKFIKIIEKDFSEKYSDACRALELITSRPMMSNSFTFCITTFPRMQYFYKERMITVYDSIEDHWGMPIDGFLHEGLHFQVTHYWRLDDSSPVSGLSEDEFNYLKEALTIVLDEKLMPLISVPDKGYKSQATFCELLHGHWQQHHDFDRLIEFGLKNLSKYMH